jgi:PIN domain nuclease of toxin-antitoxin system
MILDTCAVLWLGAGGGRLSSAALKEIKQAPEIYVSVISGFEIALKNAAGKLNLPLPPLEWLQQVVNSYSLTVLALDLQTCVKAAQLPRFHDDPYDRLIIAAAKFNNWTVVTTDERFESYGIEVIS